MTTQRPVLTFARHYGEMVAAMFLGMFVLGAALAIPLELAGVGVSDWPTEEPELALLSMAFTMSVPMAAWMRYRGHAWAPTAEMTASMFVPALAAIALWRAGAVEDTDTLHAIEHVAMLAIMFAVMLLRLDEYSGARHAH